MPRGVLLAGVAAAIHLRAVLLEVALPFGGDGVDAPAVVLGSPDVAELLEHLQGWGR